jgi:hypothetical protein
MANQLKINMPPPGRRAALWLLLIFLVALAVMVAAIAVLAILDAWWVLVTIFVLDLVATAVVLLSIAWITTDGDSTA